MVDVRCEVAHCFGFDVYCLDAFYLCFGDELQHVFGTLFRYGEDTAVRDRGVGAEKCCVG